MPKKLKIALIAVALLLPTIIAVVSYSISVSNPVTKGAVTEMDMTDIDGNVYKFTRNDQRKSSDNPAEANPIDFFIDLNGHSQGILELPSAVTGKTPYTVVYHSLNKQIAYNYYFSDTPSDAYYTNDKKEAFKIDEDYAKQFINSSYAIPLYKNANTPSLSILGSTVYPTSMTWNYKMSNGQYSEAVVPIYSGSEEQRFQASGGLHLQFVNEPDYLYVTIMQGETKLFDDQYKYIAAVSFNEAASLNVHVSAKWYEADEKSSYGEAEYIFNMDLRAPAEFYLGSSQINHGDFVVITGKNVYDKSSVSFRSEPAINFEPVFFEDGDNVMALVPISYELAYSPSYTFTITADGVENKLTLAVANKVFRSKDYNISLDLITYKRNPTTLEAFNTSLKDAFANRLETRYWTSQPFHLPCTSDQVRRGVGITLRLTETGTTYRHAGADFMVSAGDQVFAACSGVVSYIGTLDLSGRTVVIDHGYGLKTLYAHMSSITDNLAEGDVVNAGDVIGIVGETGFTSGASLHFGMYVFDVPVVSYAALGWEKDGVGIPVVTP